MRSRLAALVFLTSLTIAPQPHSTSVIAYNANHHIVNATAINPLIAVPTTSNSSTNNNAVYSIRESRHDMERRDQLGFTVGNTFDVPGVDSNRVDASGLHISANKILNGYGQPVQLLGIDRSS